MMIKEALFKPHYDPYDIWALPGPGAAKLGFYQGNFWSKVHCAFIVLMDYVAPTLLRKVFGVKKDIAGHTHALMWLSSHSDANSSSDCGASDKALINTFDITAIQVASGIGWGLPFAWWSKNGVYPANTAYITNTPYVMECLLALRQSQSCATAATDLFNKTYGFLVQLKRHINTENRLALSYAAIDEPRLVVNANSYAMFAYALHAKYGSESRQEISKDSALKLANWIVSEQLENGSWWYYADHDSGNLIDCFHSCFIIKNMIKTGRLIPEANSIFGHSIEMGWAFIRKYLFEHKSGLCKRFVVQNIRDPFIYDLYDQAEYLGLLVDFDLLSEAHIFCETVRRRFSINQDWYVRVDFFNRRWGKNFMRWGVVPFLFNEARLATALKIKTTSTSNTLNTAAKVENIL